METYPSQKQNKIKNKATLLPFPLTRRTNSLTCSNLHINSQTLIPIILPRRSPRMHEIITKLDGTIIVFEQKMSGQLNDGEINRNRSINEMP